LTILEVPVETTLGNATAFGQHLDAQAGDALFGENVDSRLDPVVAVELGSR